jgi:Membrane-bound toxin component of toxin-antitoxin system
MSDKYQTALLLALKPSKRLKKTVIFVHTLALGASMANALVIAIKISLFALICIHCWLTVRRLNAERYTIKYTDALGWEVSEGCDFASVEILKSTVITTQILFLHYRYGSQVQSWKSGHKKTLLVLNDALAGEDYRCLIVKLKTTAIK